MWFILKKAVDIVVNVKLTLKIAVETALGWVCVTDFLSDNVENAKH